MWRKYPHSLIWGLLASATAFGDPPPAAPPHPVTDDYFGVKVTDQYRWMENLKDPQTVAWMRAQADYTRATLDALPGYPALLKRVTELDSSQPAEVSSVQIVGARYYSLRQPAEAQSAKLYIRESLQGRDRLLIDPERLPDNSKSHWSIHAYRPSPDGRYIAYMLAAGGSETSTLRVFEVRTGSDLLEREDRMDEDIAAPFWRPDGESFFYSREQAWPPGTSPAAQRENKRVYLHIVHHAFADDPPVLGRDVTNASLGMSPIEFAEVTTAPASHFAIAYVSSGSDPRLRVYAAPVGSIGSRNVTWRPIAPEYADQYLGGDDADHPVIALAGDTLYWLSRKSAPRGEILRLDLARADSKPHVAVPQGPLPISAVYAGRKAIYWRVNDAGANAIYRMRLIAGAKPQALTLPYAADVADVSTDAGGTDAALLATSWLRSPSFLSVDPQNGRISDRNLQPAGPYDRPDDLAVEEVRVKSWDGTPVPLSIIHKRDLPRDGRNLTMLTGYGAYGTSMSPFYVPAMRSWYERGAIIAFAHVRGGGELGEEWHKGGFQATKPNTWKDFIACAEYLVDERYTRRQSCSAGHRAPAAS